MGHLTQVPVAPVVHLLSLISYNSLIEVQTDGVVASEVPSRMLECRACRRPLVEILLHIWRDTLILRSTNYNAQCTMVLEHTLSLTNDELVRGMARAHAHFNIQAFHIPDCVAVTERRSPGSMLQSERAQTTVCTDPAQSQRARTTRSRRASAAHPCIHLAHTQTKLS